MFGLSNFIITEFLLIFYSLVTNVLYSYINFPTSIDSTGFEFVKFVLDEIHIFDSSICIIEHIGYTTDKHIESVTFRNIDSEKLKKIINLNKLEHFEYIP